MNVAVPDASLLFTGAFSRAGSDLVLTGSDGAKLVVTGYFNTDMPPALVSPEGAMLTGDVVTSLAGPQFPGQYAQAGGGAGQAAESIGKVQTLDGGATVVRANGVTETLKVGDPVFQGDVVMTGPGGKLGISFLDGTLFSLSNNARMVLNKLVYEPNGADNSMLFNLVEGTFVFAAGKIAPTGDMKVQTPVATMGIRGTTPTVDINASLGTVNFSIVPDPSDQVIGKYTLFNLVTGLPMGTVESIGTIWRIVSATGEITQVEKSQDDLLKDAEAIGQINSVYSSWSSTQQQDPQGPQAGPDGNSSSGGINSDPPNPGSIDGDGGDTGGGENQENPNENDNDPNTQSGLPPSETDEDDGVNVPTEVAGDPGPNVINGDENPNVLNGTPIDDIINGLEDDDTIFGSPGDDQINGGEGEDTVDYSATSQGIVINLVDGTVNGEEIGFDTIASIERFVGGSGNDTLIFDVDTGFFFDGREGVDTIRFVGGVDIHTDFTDIEAENIEILDLNKTDDNTLTIAADDVAEANEDGVLQIRGGPGDQVNLTNEFFQDGGFTQGETSEIQVFVDSAYYQQGSWEKSDQTFEAEDGTVFDVYEFFLWESSEPVATAQIEQGIDVGIFDVVFGDDGPNQLVGGPGNDIIFGEGGNDIIFGDPPAPLVETSQTGTLANGRSLEVSLTMPDASSADSVDISGFVGRSDVEQPNIAFVVDISGSTRGATLEAQIDAIEALYDSIVNDAGFPNANISLIAFNSGASTEFSGAATQDNDGNGTPDFLDALRALTASGGTNFESALQQTVNFFNSAAAGANFVFFLSDGQDFGGTFTDEVATLTDPNGINATIRAFGLGSNASEEDLDLVDDGVDNNSAEIVQDPTQLSDALIGSDVTREDIDRIEFLVDGEVVGFVNGTDLTETPFGLRYDFEVTGLNPDQAEQIQVRVIATDGTEVSTQQILETGGDGNDIIVGGEGDDTLTGGGGSDTFVITSLADGVDTITDFTGDDTLDLTGLLDGAFNSGDDINEFVRATTDANGNTTVAVDIDGADGPADFADVAVLQGVAAGVAVAVNIGDDSEAVTSAAVVA